MIISPNFVRFIKYVVWTCAGVIAIWMLTQKFPDESSALLVVIFSSLVVASIFRRYAGEDREFITLLFLAGLVVRLTFGLIVHMYDLRDFFGADSETYHFLGGVMSDYWLGVVDSRDAAYRIATMSRPGWGMTYLVAAIYAAVGKNIVAAQSFCAVIGAATAPMVYFCAKQIYLNKSVAKTAAFGVAFFPAFVIWSSQLLKDGLVIFLLVLVFTMVLQLQERINYGAIFVIILSMFAIVTLRFYIFYMVAIAVVGSLVIGLSSKNTSIFKRAALLVVLGLGLTYLGVLRSASVDFERYVDLERVQVSRMDLAKSGESGFAEEADVSTTEGAISAIPIGLAYLMLAPFPWQVANVRQAITVPEVLVWWALLPLMIGGIVYTVRHRLKSAFPVLFFSLVLTLAYSIFQGNVGTAYRQRTQIQVFLFIFIAVGWQLWKERRQDKRIKRAVERRKFEQIGLSSAN